MAMLRKAIFLALVLTLIGFATACSSITKLQLARAQKLEAQGKTKEALTAYADALSRIPQSDLRLRSQVYYQIGNCFWRTGRVREAFAAFKKSTESDNSNLLAHLRLGEIYLAGGAPERATEQANTILQLASADVQGLALLGAASSAAGDDQLAKQAFTRVLEKDPKRVSVAVALADIYNKEDDIDQARTVLRNAVSAQPSSALPWLSLGRLEEQEGNSSAAEAAYRSAVAAEDTVETNSRLAQFLQRTAKIDEAEQVLRHLDHLRPTLPIALSDFKLLAGQPAAAIGRYTNALRSPAMEGKTARNSSGAGAALAANRAALAARVVESDLQLASEQGTQSTTNSGAVAAARLHLDEYRSELDPATTQILKAEIALAEGDISAAGRYSQAAVDVAPDAAPACYVRGLVRYRSGDDTGARDDWARALELDGTYVPAKLALAEQELQAGDSNAAELHVVSVVRDEPGSVRALNLFARVLLARKRYASAALIARRALALDKTMAEPHVVLGQVAESEGNVGEALHEFEQAVSANPHSEAALDGLTRIYRAGKITRSMLASLEGIAEMPPASGALMEIAGRLYAEHGWLTDARRCYKRALQIDGERRSAANLLAELDMKEGNYSGALLSGAQAGGSESSLLRATDAERLHDFDTAIREYGKSVNQGDTTGIAANNLAWLLAERGGNMERALSLAQKAKSLSPGSPAVLDTLGFVRLKRREYSQAIDVLKAAERLAKEQQSAAQLAVIQRHLAEAYFRSGQTRLASDAAAQSATSH
jgi:tetratricopeptide (TPR) repeat protein